MILDSVDASSLFTASLNSSAQMQGMQQRNLSKGMDLLSSQDYEGAIKAFKRSISYSPTSSNAVTAYQFIAQSYSKLGDSDQAIKAYQQALKIDSSQSNIQIALGNIYYYNKDYQNAVKAYEAAVKVDPGDANRYSLGQGYLANGQYSEAEEQFRKVAASSPNKPNGKYGLGLVYEKQGQYDAAILAFQDALKIKSDFTEAYGEMGFAMADSGRLDEATQIKNELTSTNASLAAQLAQYINSKTSPSFTYVASSNLNLSAYANTPVLTLGQGLIEPNSTRTFSVVFSFSKPMDISSVQNVANWTISRAPNSGTLPGYNLGLPIASTEADLAPHPVSVSYNEGYQMATVYFSISQNASADATIDPSHILFKFSGNDEDGLGMNSKADQYTGFSGIA